MLIRNHSSKRSLSLSSARNTRKKKINYEQFFDISINNYSQFCIGHSKIILIELNSLEMNYIFMNRMFANVKCATKRKRSGMSERWVQIVWQIVWDERKSEWTILRQSYYSLLCIHLLSFRCNKYNGIHNEK